MGAHRAGKKVWAPGRHHRLNQALEAIFVVALLSAATFAGWVSFQPAAAPPGSVLNPPVVADTPSRPADPPVPPVPAAQLTRSGAAPQVRPPRKKVGPMRKDVRTATTPHRPRP